MSQKTAKHIRRINSKVDDLGARLDYFIAREGYEAECRENARNKAHHDRQLRRELEAQHAVRHWQTVAYAAIIAAIMVLIVAITAVQDAKATEPSANELKISAAETMTHPEDDAKNNPVFESNLTQNTDFGKVAEDFENEKIEAALLSAATVIQDCTVSHYDCCVECCGKDDGITASGRKAVPGVTVAVDPSIIPLGSDVLVDYGDGEIHYYRADDTGSAVKGAHIDLCVSSHEEANQLGLRKATVYWVPEGGVSA